MLTSTLICLVIGISDGDTIKARCGEAGAYQQIKVRIAAIDAPEKVQPFGRTSREHLADLCFQVSATITPTSRDRYGRTVADVECRGQDVAVSQVRAGLAWYYVRYGKGYERLQAAESKARANRRGLWADESPAPPWEWRRSGG